MKRWLAIGTLLTMGSAFSWALAAQLCETRLGVTVVAWLGVFVSAWLVPVWWLVNLVLYSIAAGLNYVSGSVLGDDKAAETYFAEVRERGTSWVVVAADWGMKKYDAPWLVKAAVPEVLDVVAPMLDQPLSEGLETSRQETLGKLRTAHKITEIVRVGWAGLCFGPLWGSLLLFVWWV